MGQFWNHRRDFGLVVLAILAFANLVSAIALAFMDKPAAGGLCGALGLLLLAFVQLSRFRKFRGLGFEAELWEDKQREAEALIEQTRALLGVLASTVLTVAPRMNRMMRGFSRRELLDLGNEVETLLQAAKVPAARTANILSEVDKWTARDLAAPIARSVHMQIHERLNAMNNQRNVKFGSPITDNEGYAADIQRTRELQSRDFDSSNLDPMDRAKWPDEIRSRIANLPEFSEQEKAALTASVHEELLDLQAWVNGRGVRRPEVFFAEDTP